MEWSGVNTLCDLASYFTMPPAWLRPHRWKKKEKLMIHKKWSWQTNNCWFVNLIYFVHCRLKCHKGKKLKNVKSQANEMKTHVDVLEPTATGRDGGGGDVVFPKFSAVRKRRGNSLLWLLLLSNTHFAFGRSVKDSGGDPWIKMRWSRYRYVRTSTYKLVNLFWALPTTDKKVCLKLDYQ